MRDQLFTLSGAGREQRRVRAVGQNDERSRRWQQPTGSIRKPPQSYKYSVPPICKEWETLLLKKTERISGALSHASPYAEKPRKE